MSFIFDERPSDSPFVETIWRTHSEHAGSFISRAEIHWEMVVAKYNGKTVLTLRGPETKASLADFPANTEFFGIVFKLGTFMPHLPVRNLLDRKDAILPEATSTLFWLRGSVWQFPTYENADTFVDQLVRHDLLVCDPVVAAALQGHLNDVSLRSVQRRFLQATGLSHQAIRQIERAHRAVALLEQGVTIPDTVYEAGYADQPHLTRALKRLIGQTPAQILRASRSN